MDDVLVVGAGPAGAIAATVLARAGARVRLLDRASFPRDKLCGDTLNPGTLAVLARLGLAAPIVDRGLPVYGMRVTSGEGHVVDGFYPRGLIGRALVRRDVDSVLLAGAVAAGASFEPSRPVRRAIVEGSGAHVRTIGVVAAANEASDEAIRAPVTIAADGRRSTLAFGLELARHPASPRRWAIGAYFERVAGMAETGEMHVRHGRYIGVAAVPGGLTNVCLVKPSGPGDAALADPAALLGREIERDRFLRDRFAGARLAQRPVVLGPLAVDAPGRQVDGLLLAGDAAGFIDPMTGDGLRFAVRGGELAALAALEALEHGWTGVHDRLAARRRKEFGRKWQFNRALRALVGSRRAIDVGTATARLVPAALRVVIAYAGDCSDASS